ncbi:MAG: hypothetical protein Kow0089_18740 [Desulfobulbaceae bacterium]
MKAISEKSKEYEVVDKLINYIFVAFGVFVLIFNIYKAVTDFENFATIQNLENFYMPILLSILFIPFIYMAALIAAYETFFVRLSFFVPMKPVLRYAKLKSILSIRLNLWSLNSWSDYINKNWRFKSKEEVKEAIVAFKQYSSLEHENKEEMV